MSETVGDRIRSALDTICLPVRELERLAGLRRGTVAKVVDGTVGDPRGSTLVGVAGVLGTTSDWLAAGLGNAPSERRVRRAVAEARERLGGRHAPKVAPAASSRKPHARHPSARSARP